MKTCDVALPVEPTDLSTEIGAELFPNSDEDLPEAGAEAKAAPHSGSIPIATACSLGGEDLCIACGISYKHIVVPYHTMLHCTCSSLT